ncbi:unnamed protein product [Ilex paraguariensis]|uniref:Uncharacterized protein n=1 Tax=Ilex paraguariensis TaxID=185542 RepID=A0ABC8TPI0_9AQUA
MQLSSGNPHGNSNETMSNNQVEDLDTDENPDSFLDGSVMEKILQRRSLRMRNMQRAWLVRKYSPLLLGVGCTEKTDWPRSNYMGEMAISQSLSEYNSSSISMPCFPTTLRSHSLPSGLNEVSAGPVASCDQNDLMWVQPGDINGLKGQLLPSEVGSALRNDQMGLPVLRKKKRLMFDDKG